jgi:hypothetical protein
MSDRLHVTTKPPTLGFGLIENQPKKFNFLEYLKIMPGPVPVHYLKIMPDPVPVPVPENNARSCTCACT